MILHNPKKAYSDSKLSNWYDFHASYPPEFVGRTVHSLGLNGDSLVLDPWNGSGTTTATASLLSHKTLGIDINPVMVLLARARNTAIVDARHLLDVGAALANNFKSARARESDMLHQVFDRDAVRLVRGLEQSILSIWGRNLVCDWADFDSRTSFLYTALFRAVRKSTAGFRGSNPTWFRVTSSSGQNATLNRMGLAKLFVEALEHQVGHLEGLYNEVSSFGLKIAGSNKSDIVLGSSTSLPLSDSCVDVVITSPPYCTRIDYAVSMLPELLLLKIGQDSALRSLRDSTIGTTTIWDKQAGEKVSAKWGPSCNTFLERLKAHPSKDSRSYYLKNHAQYFSSIYTSLGELYRVTKIGGCCVLVVQDSYYKDIRNDLALIVSEMAQSLNWTVKGKADYLGRPSLLGINPYLRKYPRPVRASESVVWLVK